MTSANVKYGEDFSIAGSSGKCAKSVVVKVGELESSLKIDTESKTGKKTTSANVKYGENFSIESSSGKGAKSVGVKVGELESGLKIDKDSKNGINNDFSKRQIMEKTLVLKDHQEEVQNLLMLKLENWKLV